MWFKYIFFGQHVGHFVIISVLHEYWFSGFLSVSDPAVFVYVNVLPRNKNVFFWPCRYFCGFSGTLQLRCSALREENDLERIRAWNNNLPLPRPSSNYDTESRVMGSASTFSMSEWVKTWCDQRNHTGYWTSVYAAVVIQWDNLKFCTLVIHSWVLSECVSHLCSVSVSISGFRPDEAHYCFVSQIWYLHLDVVGWFQYTRLPQSMTKFWIRTSCFIS